ncbi:glycosyltransferase [Hydrococcus rivularis NIES-593]|uniref:Glycosyltransferase n=1 Tax=Hydrococcus rivularis NIES-593 TaxID=1921803 RepID=A0A1U7HT61_9CYAN|nr:glycosyltransferase [Hydrococcus rivularis]OKH26790.1 glycosyltransferase [Hydrococcus rivularis NIES-593]
MTNDQSKVSVIVPIYNGEADLPGLIECLRAQTYPRDRVEYLLVDNNSSDRTGQILATAAAQTSTEKINLQVLTEDKIQSSYAARNKAIRIAQGEIIAFTDADCRPQPDWLEKLVIPFADPIVGIVVGELVALPGNTILEQYAERYELMSQKFLVEHPFCSYGQTANIAIRREIFERVGLFRPYLTTGGDADICWRIQKQTGWKLEFAPQAIVRHRHRANLREFKSQWRRYGTSNRYLHELHGVSLMRELTFRESLYRLSRWLLKELPRDSAKLVIGKAKAIELIKTPIDLIGFQARTAGQKQAQLSEQAKTIEWL